MFQHILYLMYIPNSCCLKRALFLKKACFKICRCCSFKLLVQAAIIYGISRY